jgi:peptide/nickel transport system ATP-binding protein
LSRCQADTVSHCAARASTPPCSVYITHDLATTYYISDSVIIMQAGRVVESGEAQAVLDAPRHPYAIALKSAVLAPGPEAAEALNRSGCLDRSVPVP